MTTENIHAAFINQTEVRRLWNVAGDFGTIRPMVSKHESPESTAAIGFRLRLIREASGKKKAEWARMIGVTAQAWDAVEGSEGKPPRNRISLDHALLVCRATGVSLDYIYRGLHADKLPAHLLEGIQKLMQESKRKRA